MTKPTFQPLNTSFTQIGMKWLQDMWSTFSFVSAEAKFVLFINTEKKITTSIGRCKQEELNMIKLDYSC